MTWCYGLVWTDNDAAVHDFYFGPEPDDVSWTSEPVTFGGSTRAEVVGALHDAARDIAEARVTIVDNELSVDPELELDG